jgi:hypothetical protein
VPNLASSGPGAPGMNLASLLGFQGPPPANASGGREGAQGGMLDLLKANIAKTESGGNYGAVGPDTGNGNRALGKYQVMASNVGHRNLSHFRAGNRPRSETKTGPGILFLGRAPVLASSGFG